MAVDSPENFRLTVLNPRGRDPEQQFHSLPAPGEGAHPPINFHAFAACTFGAFHRDTRSALAENTRVLLLLRSDFRASARALTELKKEGRTVAVSMKETGLHQIAEQLRDPREIIALHKNCDASRCLHRHDARSRGNLSARPLQTRSRDSGVYPDPLPDRGSTVGFFHAAQRAVRHFRWHTRTGRAIAQSFRRAFGRTGVVRIDGRTRHRR